jgi:quercetin dioxygenase-like cupin family protein
VSTAHLVRRAVDAVWSPATGPLAASPGLEAWSVVDAATPAVHTGFALGRLQPGGSVPGHVHSYEESLYVIGGEVVVQTPGEAALLGPGDYGWVPVGVEHSLRNQGSEVVTWARMSAPTPRPDHDQDTQLVPGPAPTDPARPDVRDPRTRRYGHIEPAHMDPALQGQKHVAVSASMRTALLVYSGITVKMMIDPDLGAVLSTMFMVQYEPEVGVIGGHDHPFEETYLILEGRTEASFDGETYLLEPGDVAWAGVGCVHGFRNAGEGPVRWLETQAPQPPGRHSYRFARDWDHLRERLEQGSSA